eukprot:2963951-Prymnesium_polylepis.1
MAGDARGVTRAGPHAYGPTVHFEALSLCRPHLERAHVRVGHADESGIGRRHVAQLGALVIARRRGSVVRGRGHLGQRDKRTARLEDALEDPVRASGAARRAHDARLHHTQRRRRRAQKLRGPPAQAQKGRRAPHPKLSSFSHDAVG